MASKKIENISELNKWLKQVKSETATSIAKGLLQVGSEVERRAKENIYNNISKSDISFRSGKLAKSLFVSISKEDLNKGKIKVGVYSGLDYARIQEVGGLIEKKSKLLTIPASIEVARSGRKARNYPGLRFVKFGSTGKMALVKYIKATSRKKGYNKVIFWLKEQVEIPAKYYLKKAVDDTKNELGSIFKGSFKYSEGSK